MAGTYTADVVHEGQLPASKTTLYTVPSNTWLYGPHISLFNTGSTTETILLYYKRGTSRKIARIVLAGSEWAEVERHDILEAADLIEGETTTATTVDIWISAILET